jgi:hypothetical protein
MKKKWFMLVLLVSGTAFAGAAPSEISCKSKPSKQTPITLVGTVPVFGPGFDVTLNQGTAKHRFTEDKDKVYEVDAFHEGVFTLSVVSKDHHNLEFYALPKSIVFKKGGEREFHVSFDGVLKLALKPGYKGDINSQAFLRDIRMSCTLDWAL